MDEACANLFCKAEVLQDLIELLKGKQDWLKKDCVFKILTLAKQEDDEVVLQIIYVYYQLCKHPAAMDYLIKETGKQNFVHKGYVNKLILKNIFL